MKGPIAILLAAGHGKRMKSAKAKVLHEVCGRPMIHYVVDAVRGAGANEIIVVVGAGAEQVRSALANEPGIHFADQERQLGTGDAVRSCRPLLEGYSGPAWVLVGDEPLIRAEPLADLLARMRTERASCLLGTAVVADPTGFGRILRDSAGRFLKIVEQRDCSPEELLIREVNPSCYVFTLPELWDALDRLDTLNAQNEYYLTDAPSLLQRMGKRVVALPALEAEDILGVNTRRHLADANAIMRKRILGRLMDEGVSIVDPESTYIDGRAEIGQDTVVHPFTFIGGRVKIGANCRIGPFAHVREGVSLADGVEIGAFVEIVRSDLAPGVMVRHLSYLGDSRLAEGVNVGAGTITANYDGKVKSECEIGERAFLGSGSILIAPATIGAGATVGAGAVVTRQSVVDPGDTVVGVPAKPKRSGGGGREGA